MFTFPIWKLVKFLKKIFPMSLNNMHCCFTRVLSRILLHTIPGNGYKIPVHYNRKFFFFFKCIVVLALGEHMLYRHLYYHSRENGYLDIPHPEILSYMNHNHRFANEVPELEDVLFIISDVCQLSIQGAGLFKNWGFHKNPNYHHLTIYTNIRMNATSSFLGLSCKIWTRLHIWHTYSSCDTGSLLCPSSWLVGW